MVARSSESSTGTTTRRRRVRKNDDDQQAVDETPAPPAAKEPDDASDVIFEEADDGTPRRKSTTRRRKKATRRRRSDEESADSSADDRPVTTAPDPDPITEALDEWDSGERDPEPQSDWSPSPRRRGRRPRPDREERETEEFEPNDEEPDPRSSEQPGENRSGEFSEDEDGRPRRRRRRRRRRQGGYGDEPASNDRRGPSRQQDSRPHGRRGSHDQGRGPNDHGRGPGDSGRGQDRGGRRGRPDNRDNRDSRGPNRRQSNRVRTVLPSDAVIEGTLEGVLELHPKGYGFLRDPKKNYIAQESDPFVPSSIVEKCGLREGVLIRGEIGSGIRNQGPRLKDIELIDGMTVEEFQEVKNFEDQTPITPYKPIRLETGPRPVTMRVMDLLTPIGKGQRALIVAPPRTGKTMLLQDIADSVSINHPETHLMVLLIDERPEEVTEMQRRVKGEVIASSMDRDVESHVRMSQLIIERAKRMAEVGKDVFVLMDSITRMARAFNKWSTGGRGENRTMSGGLHVKALDIPKKLFGTARQFENGGSLTIAATALIETNSKMDEVIFQEFKGTGNMELVLSRDLADRRIWPAIDITRSGTRHEEKLFSPEDFDSIVMLRRSLISLSPVEAMEQLTRTLDRFPTNKEFLRKVKAIL